MRKNFTAVDYTAFVIVGFAATVALLYIAFGWSKLGFFLNDASTAAWVQAFGSIGAIIATGWAVHKAHVLQITQRQRQEEAEYTHYLEYAYQLVGGMRDVVRTVADAERASSLDHNTRRSVLANIDAFQGAFGRFDLSRLRGYHVSRAVLAGDAITKMVFSDLQLTFDPDYRHKVEKFFLFQAAQASLVMLEEHAETLAIALRDRRGVARSETLTL